MTPLLPCWLYPSIYRLFHLRADSKCGDGTKQLFMMAIKEEPRGLRNNNPGNLVKSKGKPFDGEIKSDDDKFKKFISIGYGYRAIFRTLHTYIEGHKLNTIRKAIYRYAPPEDRNDTEAYIRSVCSQTGIDENQVIDWRNHDDMVAIVSAISCHENGVKADKNEVERGWNMFINTSDIKKHL